MASLSERPAAPNVTRHPKLAYRKNADFLCYDMGNFFHMQLNRKAVVAELEKRNESFYRDI